MITPPLTDEGAVPVGPASMKAHRLRRLVGFTIGLGLFGAAVWVIARGGADFRSALDAARHAPWWLGAAVVVLPLVNWLLVGTSFWVLQNRYGSVGWREMLALIASAWLLNYLPLRPGMFGRLAYHKHVNQIRYADSARVLVYSVSLTGVSIGLLLVIAILVRFGGAWGWVWCVPAPIVMGAAAIALRPHGPLWWRLATSALLKYLDMMVWIWRYAAAFALIGSPLDFQTALFVAAVSQAAFLIPLAGNGLGIREWGVRAASAVQIGLLADVVNRAAEVTVSLPLGLVGTAWAARRMARLRAERGILARPTPEQAASGGPDPESGR
ncbi:MAG: flippase-like domain-containing protein [Phycisphaeraceae bacterium]|nr:MAG: flippase-like domain-containing protein [Phycisphaeraceae bacterium]